MLQSIVAVLVVCLAVAQNEEPFSLPTLSGNAFFAEPFANTETIGGAWKLSTSAKGKDTSRTFTFLPCSLLNFRYFPRFVILIIPYFQATEVSLMEPGLSRLTPRLLKTLD